MSLSPAAALEQKRAAIIKATQIRQERARLKQKLRDGDNTFDEALDAQCAQTMKVEKILLCLPGVGKAKVGKWFKALGISHLVTVEQLSESRRRQLEELVG